MCNSTSLGGLVKLDPKRVHMDDGMFELILLRMPKTALDLQNLITALNRMDYDYPGVISALNSTGRVILKDHIAHCIVDAVESGDNEAVDSLNQAIDRFMR